MPVKLQDLKRVMSEMCGATVSTRGKHMKFVSTDGSKCWPMKAHNGLRSEIADYCVKGLCREFEIDEAVLRSKL